MAASEKRQSKREALIKAGVEEINKHGITGFSIRRVAETCGVSCAAPAKHFGDRKGFIAAIISYVNSQWHERQREIMDRYSGDLRKEIVELSVGYVQFLVEHPHFRSILMLKDDEFDNSYHKLRGELSSPTQKLVAAYCEKVHMDEATRERKQYVIRALIFGAALMFDNGEMEYCDRMIENVRYNIDREFDLA
ncbi:MAG: TetR family transcriptional regulator [Oscillospiraceae bacterium]|nr:TetR family transcriptional regulator [Oscillospiraceae bacterium]